MKQSTLKITTGAMFIALFAIILLLNRQTGGILEELVFYILPIPMVAYSARYGWKTSIPVLIAMGLISIFFGTITTIFYAVTEAFIGMVLGSCIYKKVDMTKTLFAVMFLSVVVNVLNTIVLASLFGYNLVEEIDAMKEMMQQVMTIMQNNGMGAGTKDAENALAMLESMLTPDFLMRMLVISMVLLGALQGFLIFQLSLLILNRLRFNIPKPKSIFEYYPPRWLSYIAIGLFGVYTVTFNSPLLSGTARVIVQTAGLCGTYYMMLFGFIGIVFFLKTHFARIGLLSGLIAFACLFLLPTLLIIVGVFYICTDWHKSTMEEMAKIREEIEKRYPNMPAGVRREYNKKIAQEIAEQRSQAQQPPKPRRTSIAQAAHMSMNRRDEIMTQEDTVDDKEAEE